MQATSLISSADLILVALSGSRSIGNGRCFDIIFCLYNQSGSGRLHPATEQRFRKKLDRLSPLGGDGNVTLDATPEVFDNQYFKDLVNGRRFLKSDKTLFKYHLTREYVRWFSANQDKFFEAFVEGMIKMGDQSGCAGEIRRNCEVPNSHRLEQRREISSPEPLIQLEKL
uniref:Lignin-forming anionic peroxidase n=1 Tax=Nicotiana tabacum TaxID=4097 RepID=A0A1S4AW06_TOBAC|nr:PREDICTED: peroxidase 17-like [Nicotiana tabacum]